MKTFLLGLCLFFCIGFGAVSQAAEEVPVPTLNTYVTDTTHTLSSSTVNQLNQALYKLDQEKGSQLVVVMVPTVQPETIEDFARKVFDHNKIGRAKIDDGVLFLIAKDDHRMRIEPGYGLEGAITDVQASDIINQMVAPHFKQNDYDGGVVAGVDALTKLIQGEDLPAVQHNDSALEDMGFNPAVIIFFLVFLLFWPAPLAAVVAALFVFAVTGSSLWAIGGAVGGLIWNLLLRRFIPLSRLRQATGRQSPSSSILRGLGTGLGAGLGSRLGRGFRRGGRDDDGFGGFGGGGGFSGGGGSSGGGGASGGW